MDSDQIEVLMTRLKLLIIHNAQEKVNYVLDCDIKGFFLTMWNHEWLMKFLRNDIADPNYLRYSENAQIRSHDRRKVEDKV